MKRLILLVLAGLAAAMAAQADIIYVQGDVSGTWAADTVIVTGEVRVPPGQTLMIQPGVKVLFQVYCKFIVDTSATLRAVGTETDSILFDALEDTAHWHGIRFLSASDSSRLEYCHLRNGWASGSFPDDQGGAIYCYNSSPTVMKCLIDSCAAFIGGAIYCAFGSNSLISSNTICADSAYYGGAISCYYSNPTIDNNAISANLAQCGGGIYCSYFSNPTISNNTISGNSTGYAGAIYCDSNCCPRISGNTLNTNSAIWSGGGIYCNNSSPHINGNIISENSASDYSGGGIYCNNSSPRINGNIINENSASDYGGGIHCYFHSNPAISKNTVSGNSAGSAGGIGCDWDSNPRISSNTISGNIAAGYYGYGGAIYLHDSDHDTFLELNEINGNIAADNGGGICISSSRAYINKNTVAGNSAVLGGGIYSGSYASQLVLINCIPWGNSLQQVYVYNSSHRVTYCDIEGGYTGLGNINAYPAFVDTAHDDYRLLWGSPCIDTGDPNPIYNDPDGTRADMGAFYYDQSVMVRILLTPHEIPYLIPETGGSMDFTIRAFNRDSLSHAARIWCDITFPDSSVHGPVLGPVRVTLGAGALLERVRTQNIPAAAPMGVYHYNAYAVVGADTSKDSFMWGKLGAGGLVRGAGEQWWTNTGEPITDVEGSRPGMGLMNQAPTEYALHPCSPNPFNAMTVARFEMRDASHVRLEIYDAAGRLVEILVNGWRAAGAHEVTFDAAALPSGMYFCRMQAGEFEAVQKMILLK